MSTVNGFRVTASLPDYQEFRSPGGLFDVVRLPGEWAVFHAGTNELADYVFGQDGDAFPWVNEAERWAKGDLL